MAGTLVRLGHRNQQQLRLRLRNRGRWADGTIARFSPVPVSRAVRRSVSRVSLVRLGSLGENPVGPRLRWKPFGKTFATAREH